MPKILFLLAILFASFANAATITQFELDTPVEAPNMRFTDDQNNIHNLSDYKGKVVLLNFWATWCNPCVHEMPVLEKLAKSMIGKDVEILAVSIDSKGAPVVQEFYKEMGIEDLSIYLDTKGKAFKDFKLQALPTTMVIDRKGMVVAKVMGEIDWDSDEVRKYLLTLGSK